MTETFYRYLLNDCGLPERVPVLLAVSGGLDSMVMAELFHEIGWPFAIAHCNFQLRGEESEGDAHFVAEWAKRADVPFFIKKFETNAYAETQGISIQMAARSLRYEWLESLAQDNGYKVVATAHHLNDSVETALLNFIRGAGLKGLRGIPARSEHRLKVLVVRPVAFATRIELEELARQKQINWREDSSNAHADYDRNYLRHQLLPMLQQLNPGFLQTAGKNLQKLRETDNNLDFLTRTYLELDGDGGAFSIEKKRLTALPHPGRLLREWLRSYQFDEEQCRQMADHLEASGFELTSETGWRAVVERHHFRVVKADEAEQDTCLHIQKDDLMVRLPDGSRMMMLPALPGAPFPDGREAILADLSSLSFPMTLRHWQSGDVFQPFGMNGRHQTLQDYFTNQKLSTLEKEACWLLCNRDGAIVWVVGHRMDERFRVKEGSRHLMRFQFGQ